MTQFANEQIYSINCVKTMFGNAVQALHTAVEAGNDKVITLESRYVERWYASLVRMGR